MHPKVRVFLILFITETGSESFLCSWLCVILSLLRTVNSTIGSLAAQYDSLDLASSSLISSWQMSKTTSFNCKIIPVCAKLYIVATSNFSLINLFGEGTRVFVYRADIPHGKVSPESYLRTCCN